MSQSRRGVSLPEFSSSTEERFMGYYDDRPHLAHDDPADKRGRIIRAMHADERSADAYVDWVFRLVLALDTYDGPSSVYFISAPASNLVKIGRSTDPVFRLARLRLLSPVPLQILHVAPGGSEIERLLHEGFSDVRSHGEWFHATRGLIAFIAEMTTFAAKEAVHV